MSKRQLKKAWAKTDRAKKNTEYELPGVLGFTLGGANIVEVPNRLGYVYVRLRNNLNEVIQVFNDKVSPVYNLPVIITKDEIDKRKYVIVGRDTGIYNSWGISAYGPRHGNQHSFNPAGGGGGDVVYVYSRQFMPLLGRPSGSHGSANIIVEQYTFHNGTRWISAGGTGTASLVTYNPTGSNSRVVLVYVDVNGNPQISAGSYFASSLTGTNDILPYVPATPASTIPVCAVRLVSGTSVILWDNIYDLRPLVTF